MPSFPQHGFPASLKRFPSGYEDPLTEIVPSFEQVPAEQPPQDSSIDHNNKLLSFSIPIYNFTLLDYSLRRSSISMSAQLHGMFFLAESPWTTSPAENTPPQQGAELTCYRRNLFQITGSITLPRNLRYIMTEQGDRIPVLAQELTVSATESVEGNPVKIISVPWKTPAANSANSNPTPVEETPTTKVEKEPPSIPLDIMAGQDLDNDYATFPIAWKRLQFRVATANNGRRKELQQHFLVRLKVVATLSTGAKIPICEIQSAPVIVRGRSPRNFQSRKDLPLSGSAAASRKSAQASASAAAAVNRTPTSESALRGSGMTPARAAAAFAANSKPTGKSSSPDPPALVPPPGSVPPPQQQHASPDWAQIHHTTAGGASIPPHPPLYHSHSSPEFPTSAQLQQHRTNSIPAPINLSVLDDDDTATLDNSEAPTTISSYSNDNDMSNKNVIWDGPAHPAKMRKISHGVTAATGSGNIATSLPLVDATNLHQPFTASMPFPNDNADMLYEYFPLGLDDWQTPVDAVYRPHMVHHAVVPDTKLNTARGRNKRYFAAEDVF